MMRDALLLFRHSTLCYLLQLIKPPFRSPVEFVSSQFRWLLQVFSFFPPYYEHGDSDRFFLKAGLGLLPLIQLLPPQRGSRQSGGSS